MSSDHVAAYEPNSPAVAGEIIDGEAIILHLPKGHYFSSEGSGAFIWAGIEKRVPVAEISAAMADLFGINAERASKAVDSFVSELLRHELIRPGSPATDAWQRDEASFGPFSQPVLEIYTDMQHLLLLDPIHDVDQTGWPVAPGAQTP